MKEFKIQVPEGYEIDRENSTFECIKFKPKKLTYEYIMEKVFKGNAVYFANNSGAIEKTYISATSINRLDPNNCTSEKQVEKLLAINKLLNVAKYLNDGWKFEARGNNWYIGIDSYDNSIYIDAANNCVFNNFYFKSKELAEQAIEILGEEVIRLALSTDW